MNPDSICWGYMLSRPTPKIPTISMFVLCPMKGVKSKDCSFKESSASDLHGNIYTLLVLGLRSWNSKSFQ